MWLVNAKDAWECDWMGRGKEVKNAWVVQALKDSGMVTLEKMKRGSLPCTLFQFTPCNCLLMRVWLFYCVKDSLRILINSQSPQWLAIEQESSHFSHKESRPEGLDPMFCYLYPIFSECDWLLLVCASLPCMLISPNMSYHIRRNPAIISDWQNVRDWFILRNVYFWSRAWSFGELLMEEGGVFEGRGVPHPWTSFGS